VMGAASATVGVNSATLSAAATIRRYILSLL
jgi:hypothetical protein